MKQFTSVHDVANISSLVQKALDYKAAPLVDSALGINKKIGLLFLNPSLRTRISTQLAAKNLGMETVVFNIEKEGWNLEMAEGAVMNGTTVEHIKDAAPVLGAYFNVLCIRTFPSLSNKEDDYSEYILNQFIKYCGVPVVSLESATLHPLQSLADIISINEHHHEKRKPKIVLTWAPHIKPIPQCVANSFAQWINKWGQADFTIAHPVGYDLDPAYTNGAVITNDQNEALKGADFVYVKNWSSYNDYGKVACTDNLWMLTEKHMQLTNNARLMHCLPVRRNVELSDEVLDSNYSIVTKQAGNRVWAAQAVLSEIIRNN